MSKYDWAFPFFYYLGEMMIKETKYKGYLVSDDGKVYSAKIQGGRKLLDYSNLKELKPSNKCNYYVVCFFIDGKKLYKSVHRLIYETFNGEIPNNMTIDHINNNSLDNRLCNLQLLTALENGVKRNTLYNYGHQRIFLIKDCNTDEIFEMTKSQIAKKI